MFSPISSQHVHQPATVAKQPTTQPHTATGMEALMAKLEQAIAELSVQQGGPGQGKDDQFTQSPSGSVVAFPGGGGGLANGGGNGAGPMGGVIGNNTAFSPVGEEHGNGQPKAGAMGGVIGNNKSFLSGPATLDVDHGDGPPKGGPMGGVIGNRTETSLAPKVSGGGGFRPSAPEVSGGGGIRRSAPDVRSGGGIRPSAPESPDIPVRGHSSATGGVIGNKNSLGLALQPQAFLEGRGGFGGELSAPTRPVDYPVHYLDGKAKGLDLDEKADKMLDMKGGGGAMGGVIGNRW